MHIPKLSHYNSIVRRGVKTSPPFQNHPPPPSPVPRPPFPISENSRTARIITTPIITINTIKTITMPIIFYLSNFVVASWEISRKTPSVTWQPPISRQSHPNLPYLPPFLPNIFRLSLLNLPKTFNCETGYMPNV